MLPLSTEGLLEVSAAVASRSEPALHRAFRLAQRFSSRQAVDEVLLQSHLFVGFPIALEALMLWRRSGPTSHPATAPDPTDLWAARGEAICRTVYGRSYEKLRANVAALHPDLDRWMVVGGYGRVIGRPGLSLTTRELCIVSLLVVWKTPRQLHSHLRGAANAGATIAEVDAAVEVGCRYLDAGARTAVWEMLAKIRMPAPVLSGSAKT